MGHWEVGHAERNQRFLSRNPTSRSRQWAHTSRQQASRRMRHPPFPPRPQGSRFALAHDHKGPFRGPGGESMCKMPPSWDPRPGSLSNRGGRPKTQAKVRIIRPVTSKPAAEPRKTLAKSSPQPFSPIRSPATKASPQTPAAHAKPHNGLHSLDRSHSLQVGHWKALERSTVLGTGPPQTGHLMSRIPVSPTRERGQATASSVSARLMARSEALRFGLHCRVLGLSCLSPDATSHPASFSLSLQVSSVA